MDLSGANLNKSGNTRTVRPLDIEALEEFGLRDPDFWVTLKEDDLVDTAERWDRYGHNPGDRSKKKQQVRAVKIGLIAIRDSIVDFGGMFDKQNKLGMNLGSKPVPCTKETKELFVKLTYPIRVQPAEDSNDDAELDEELHVESDVDEEVDVSGIQWKTLYTLAKEAVDRQVLEEIKNSTRSSNTGTAVAERTDSE